MLAILQRNIAKWSKCDLTIYCSVLVSQISYQIWNPKHLIWKISQPREVSLYLHSNSNAILSITQLQWCESQKPCTGDWNVSPNLHWSHVNWRYYGLAIIIIILLHEKLLQFDWLRAYMRKLQTFCW